MKEWTIDFLFFRKKPIQRLGKELYYYCLHPYYVDYKISRERRYIDEIKYISTKLCSRLNLSTIYCCQLRHNVMKVSRASDENSRKNLFLD